MTAAARRSRGQVAHLSGNAAEDGVAARYAATGHTIAERRWRCAAGEIDLILRKDETVVFVEVKRARDFQTAATRIGPRQLARISQAAELFLGAEPRGTDTPARIDVALVDGAGRIEILENVLVT